jgi:DNA-binding NarL/FixJ family response regulator
MTPIRVLLADDYALFRQGVATLLGAQRGFEVVGQAGDGLQALDMARALSPDVVLMDVSMPVMDGFEATRRIKAEMPAMKIVILTVSVDAGTRLEAERSGAQDCLPKRVEPHRLCGALRDAVAGQAAWH